MRRAARRRSGGDQLGGDRKPRQRERVRAQQRRDDGERSGAARERERRRRPRISANAPALAAPSAAPSEAAVASHANASVAVPDGAARSTMAYTVAKVGAIAAPASSSTAPSARMLSAAATSPT